MSILDSRPANPRTDPFAVFADEVGDALIAAFDQAAAVPAPKPAPAPRCLGCGRTIRAAASVARGYGEGCWRRAHRRASLLADSFNDQQVEQAVEAVEDGAVVPAAVPAVWYVVASAGDAVYETTTAGRCTCAAGDNGRVCWHLAAVALVDRAAA